MHVSWWLAPAETIQVPVLCMHLCVCVCVYLLSFTILLGITAVKMRPYFPFSHAWLNKGVGK